MEATEGQQDVAKEGYMTRMKTKKQKYFVLKHGYSNMDDTDVPIPHLNYYINQEKYHSNPLKPRRSILLPDCIGISTDPHPFLHPSPPLKHFDLLKLSRPGMISKREKHQITLKEWTQTFKENLIHIYTTKDVFVVSLDGETERDEWFDKLIQLRNVWLKSLNLQKHFKRNWRIKMLNRSTNYEVIYKPGYYYVFMGEVSVVLLLDEEDKEVRYDFPLDSIMRFGDRQELFFFETGYSCPTGLGELWFSAEDSIIASNIYHHFLYLLKFRTRKKSLIESMKKEPPKRQDDTLNQLMNEKAPENKSPKDVTDSALNSAKGNEKICLKNNQISIPSPPTIAAEKSNDKLKNCQKLPPLHNHKASLHRPFDNFEATESSSDSSSLSGFNRPQYFDHYVQMRTSSVGTKQDCLNRVVDDKSISAPHLPHHEEGFVLRKYTPTAYMDMSGNKQSTTSASLFFSTPAPLKTERQKEEIYVHIDYPKQPKSGVTQYILGTLKSIPHRVLRSHPSKLIKKEDEEDIEESINRPRLSTIPSERHRLSFLSRISRPRAFTFGQARAKEPPQADSVPIETKIELLLQQYEQERQQSIKQCMEGYERMDLGPIPLAGVELMTQNEPYPYVPMDFIPPSTKVTISCTCVKTTVNSPCASCVSGSSLEKPTSHYIDMHVNLPKTNSDAIQITQKIKTSTSPLMSTSKYTPNTTATFTEASLKLLSHPSSPHYLDMNSNLDSINNNDKKVDNDNNSNHPPISSIPYLLKNHVDNKKTDANQKNDQINLCTNCEKTFNTH